MDAEFKVRMQRLAELAAKSALPAALTLVRDGEFRFFLLGPEENFDMEMRAALRDGFRLLGTVGAVREAGKVLLLMEAPDGAAAADVTAAKAAFASEMAVHGLHSPATS